jgi:hypothetical protein
MNRTLWLLWAVLVLCLPALCPTISPAQSRESKEAIVIFRDGFYVKGVPVQKKDWIVDPYSGNSIAIPAGGEYLYVDDGIRRINFSMGQVQTVLDVKHDPTRDQLRFLRKGVGRKGNFFESGALFEEMADWDNKWERTIKVKTPKGRTQVRQRITGVSPTYIVGVTLNYDWDFAYNTREFDPRVTRKLILDYLAENTPLKEFEKRAIVAKFFAQAGGYEVAGAELAKLTEDFPEQSEAIKELRSKVGQQKADADAIDIERCQRTGWHAMAQAGLAEFADDAKAAVLSDKNRLIIQDLKTKYETWNMQLAQAQEYLKEFPKHAEERARWTAACKAILQELSIDGLTRMKTFLEIAPQHARELNENKKPTQRTEELLALAVTGWLQGDNAAVTDRKAALQLYETRETLLSYLRTDSPLTRQQLLTSFTKRQDVPLDVLIRLIRLLPPVAPYTEKLNDSAPTKLNIDLQDSNGGDYYLQLPPEYDAQRPYPLLLVLHSHREKPDAMMKRWQEQAARNGFILAAPVWGTGKPPKYGFTKGEHEIVLDTLRDLRRKFNIDSDRVFLFGWEQGANAAFDIGLSHPDQFAGVLPMNGDVTGFPHKYGTNAQYLPFYIVEGDRNGALPTYSRIFFKDWIRGNYPSLYVEYKGRSSEWYASELPNMMDWMNRKKRHHPLKQMGRAHTGGGSGEEFKTMRAGDNRYYWLSTDEILDDHINSQTSWSVKTKPATLQADIKQVNEASKTGQGIWSHINIRTFGVKQVSLWLPVGAIDFTRPVVIRLNSVQIGGHRMIAPSAATLLEELYNTGDRQRLFVARLDFRP